MSVINEMLHDLAQRRAQPGQNTPVKPVAVHAATFDDDKRRFPWYLWLIMTLAIVCLAAVFLWPRFMRPPTSHAHGAKGAHSVNRAARASTNFASESVSAKSVRVLAHSAAFSARTISSQSAALIVPQKITGLSVTPAIISHPEQLWQRAQQQLSLNNIVAATQTLRELMRATPEDVRGRELLVRLLLQQHAPQSAQKILTAGLMRSPDWPPFIQLKASLLVGSGDVAGALRVLQQHTPSLAAFPQYHAMVAALYQRTHQSLLAAQRYQQLLQLQPRNGVWWVGLAVALESSGQHEDALAAFAQARDAHNLNPELQAYVDAQLT